MYLQRDIIITSPIIMSLEVHVIFFMTEAHNYVLELYVISILTHD